jgi:phosphoribosylamine--glycine ligase
VLYAGLMLTPAGPKVLEFNVRFGDPETQVVLPRWQGDVAGVLHAAAAGRLDEVAPPEWSPGAAVCVVLAAPGYPEAPTSGAPIAGLPASTSPDATVHVYAAGVGRDGDRLVTAGGRVVGVTGRAPTLEAARDLTYQAAAAITWSGVTYRHDIAASAAEAARKEATR